MANFVYAKAKQALLNGEINVSASNYRVALLNSNLYSPNQMTDEYVSSIPPGALVARSGNISGVTNTNGVLDANDVDVECDGSFFDSIVVYQVGASDSSSKLFFYIDTSTGLPFEGSNSSLTVTISWSDTANKILAL